MKVVPSFVYLGVLLHWFLPAIAAEKDRDTTGLKAFGSSSASLNKAPFLPFHQTLEIAESTVGGAFLHGAELWGAFISLFFSRSPTRILRVASRVRVETACRPASGLAGTQRPGSTGDCACDSHTS